ncbi:carbohydrate kinase family protein [Geofilum sp. OHC36d9]|uniref:carbohydrate kinase family protein n=1 Tax=Geofilum sp. OHC36d9 TaxID=3458413 RepID=UPI0040340A7E
MKQIVCYGEVLWDMLPSGKKLGGAPLNVALRAQSFGCDARVISSIGKDAAGDEIVEQMKAHSASINHLQVSENYATSEVLVYLNEAGSASYEIKMPCAWDDIKLLDKDLEVVKASDAFIFGSLAARKSTSRETLFALLEAALFKVFDVNLRSPHYEFDTLLKLMTKADFIKLNDDEIFKICNYMNADAHSLEACIRFIAEKTHTKSICVTLGAAGAVVFQDNKFTYNKGYKIVVADTVGSGDSFLGTLISQLLSGATVQVALDYASAVGALVASKQGANPKIEDGEIALLMKQK